MQQAAAACSPTTESPCVKPLCLLACMQQHQSPLQTEPVQQQHMHRQHMHQQHICSSTAYSSSVCSSSIFSSTAYSSSVCSSSKGSRSTTADTAATHAGAPVAPLVKVIHSGGTESAAATASRALDTSAAAAQPRGCLLEGFPNWPACMHACISVYLYMHACMHIKPQNDPVAELETTSTSCFVGLESLHDCQRRHSVAAAEAALAPGAAGPSKTEQTLPNHPRYTEDLSEHRIR